MAKIRIVGDSSGYVELAAPNAAGNNTLELPASGTKLVGADANGAVTVGTGASISSPATNVLTLGTNNTESVRIDSSGNTGIGTNNPSQRLDVHGQIFVATSANSTQNFRYRSPDSNWHGSINQSVSGGTIANTIGVGGRWDVSGTTYNCTKDLNGSFPSAALSIQNQYNSNNGARFAFLSKAAGSTTTDGSVTELAVLDSSGNLGIGTANPTSRLEVQSSTIPRIISNYNNSKHIGMSVGGSGGGFTLTDGHFLTINHQPYTDRGTDNNFTERVRIDSSGRMTLPYQPSFFAYVTTGDTTTADATIIVFNATAHNTGSHYSISTGRFTAPVSGVYAFHAQIWAKNGANYSRTMFRVAGAQVTQNGFHPGTVSNSNDHSFQMSMVRYVTAGDAVDVMVNLGPLTYYGGGAQAHTYFTGHLVG